jgi:hypothetical protein
MAAPNTAYISSLYKQLEQIKSTLLVNNNYSNNNEGQQLVQRQNLQDLYEEIILK